MSREDDTVKLGGPVGNVAAKLYDDGGVLLEDSSGDRPTYLGLEPAEVAQLVRWLLARGVRP